MSALGVVWRILVLISLVAAAINMWSPDPAWGYRLAATFAMGAVFGKNLMEIFGVRLKQEAQS